MSKVSMVERNNKRKKMILKFSTKRKELKAKISSTESSSEEKFEAMISLSELPRNSSSTRYRLRCKLTGRPRGNLKKFELSRNKFRELALKGQIPGVFKASW